MIPFLWHGTSLQAGMDCFTYASHISKQHTGRAFDLTLAPIADAYQKYTGLNEKPRSLLLTLARELNLTPVTDLEPMTLVLMRSHSGLCLGTVLEGDQVTFMGAAHSETVALASFDGDAIVAAFDARGLHIDSGTHHKPGRSHLSTNT